MSSQEPTEPAEGDAPAAPATQAGGPTEFQTHGIPFQQWGNNVDEQSRQQMREACSLPVSYKAALMPDAHVGYGLPIGGVLATENSVIPYAVGVDIACRMRLSITDLPINSFDSQPKRLDKALEGGTRFGVGAKWKSPQQHDVMDQDWTFTPFVRHLKDLAASQLGTSGSGNHFVEWGLVNLPAADMGLEAGTYVALLSHSGSRGPGAQTCQRYSQIAAERLAEQYADRKRLAWLSLDSEAGQEYWLTMTLMGEFAAANHAVIHRNVNKLAGAKVLATVENHHNYAWKEVHDGREVVVHRKGATPAGKGVLGVVPGNMADSAYIVRGKGSEASVDSCSHGAGRVMSRTAAKKKYRWKEWRDFLKARNVRVLAAGLDEVPGVYKNIHEVMADQADLVDVVATFDPRIVLMCGDNSRAED